ncbi:MAG TPA: hypothetical protein VHN13_14810 [Candidatus Tectomicrobia bacterium]|nr:hypothetical protein [Candidatus Tectomicrobia bacterium]
MADLNPTHGLERARVRSVLVFQNDTEQIYHNHSGYPANDELTSCFSSDRRANLNRRKRPCERLRCPLSAVVSLGYDAGAANAGDGESGDPVGG